MRREEATQHQMTTTAAETTTSKTTTTSKKELFGKREDEEDDLYDGDSLSLEEEDDFEFHQLPEIFIANPHAGDRREGDGDGEVVSGTRVSFEAFLEATKIHGDDPLLVEDLSHALEVEAQLKDQIEGLKARKKRIEEEIPSVALIVEGEAKRAKEVVGVLRDKISCSNKVEEGKEGSSSASASSSALLRARERVLSEEQRVLVKEIEARCEKIESLTSLQHYLGLATRLEDLKEEADALVELMIQHTMQQQQQLQLQQRRNSSATQKALVESASMELKENSSILDLTLSLREIADVATSFGYLNLRGAAEEAEKEVRRKRKKRRI